MPERSYGGDCGLFRRKSSSGFPDGAPSPPSSVFPYELNLASIKATLLDEFVVAHALGWWAKAILLRDRRVLWPLSVGFELAEGALAHALPNFSECWWDRWVLDVGVCNFVGMELGMATAALLRARERAGEGGSGEGGSDRERWGGVSTKRGALAKARRVAAQFSPRSWDERDWGPGSSTRRAVWALFLVGAFLLFDVSFVFFFPSSFSSALFAPTLVLTKIEKTGGKKPLKQLNSFFLKAALWVPQLNPLTLYRLCGFFLLGLPAFKEFYRFVVAADERAAEAEERRKLSKKESSLLPPLPAKNNRLGPCAWLMLAIIATETLVAVKFGPRLLPLEGMKGLPRSARRAAAVLGVAAVGLAGCWLWSGLLEERRRRRLKE